MMNNKKIYSLLLLLLLFVCCFCFLEFSPYIIYPIFKKHSFSRDQVKYKINSLAIYETSYISKNKLPIYLRDKIFHPYIGFTYKKGPSDYINEYGFFGPKPIKKPKKNEIHIAITGGSVAGNFIVQNGSQLRKELSSKIFNNKKIVLYDLFLDGMKQPQQLHTLTYFLSLGKHFDIVINIDGFNEISLPYIENISSDYLHYPRGWFVFSKTLSETTMEELGVRNY